MRKEYHMMQTRLEKARLDFSRLTQRIVQEYVDSILTLKSGRRDPAVRLSPRQQEIFNLVMQGFQRKEIASRLGIAERTVKFHFTAIFRKYGVQTKNELVILCKT